MTNEEWLEFSAEIWFCVFLHPSKKMGKRRRDRAMKRLQEQHPDIHQALWSLRSEEHTSELQSQPNLVCRLLLEKNEGEPNPVSDRPDGPPIPPKEDLMST